MTSQELIQWIHDARTRGVKRGLENTRELLEAMNLVPGVPVIHVAGTNGKGSTCAMLESVLRTAGYRTGLFTSPYLSHYHERIRLNGRPVTDGILEQDGPELVLAAERLRGRGVEPTPFELGTALAAHVFREAGTDVWILEAGMGGRTDPTTAIKANLCAISSIGLDHRERLGNTIEEIAWQKAGIMRSGVTCVASWGPGVQTLRRAAEESNVRLICPPGQILHLKCMRDRTEMEAECTRMHRILLPLPGRHQSGNALLAIRVLEEAEKLGFVIPEEALKQGMAQVRWPARLEWNGRFLLDGAHNPPAMRALGAYVRSFLDEPPILLSAVMDDKDAESIAGELSAFIRAAVTVPLAEQRAMDPQTWAEHLRHHGITAYAEESLKSGLQKACELAGTGTVLCTGSLYLVGQLRDMLCMEDRPESDD